MEIYVYARWSSLEQGKGSTLSRQIANCRQYLEARGLREAGEPIIDRGRSAFTGENITIGNLGKFADRVRSGVLGGSVHLIVEELDRLSRRPPDVMLAWLSPLIRGGVTIHVTQTGQVIDVNMLDHDMGGLLTLLVTAFGSFTESRKKSQRVAAAWERKRSAARDGEHVTLTHRSPAWIEVENGQFVVRPQRRAVIERIFRRRIEGAGKGIIAKELNADGVEIWSNTSRAASMWSATYVGRILTNRAVIGEWQPFACARGAAERLPVGDPIEGYYPSIISVADFARANDQREANQRKHVGRGRAIANVLGEKARCSLCGGQMVALGSSRERINKRGERHRYYFLYCETAKVGKACAHQVGWTYDRVERPLLDSILSSAMDDQHFGAEDTSDAERAVFEVKARLDGERRRLDRWAKIINSDDEAAATAAMAEWTGASRAVIDAESALDEAVAGLEKLKGRVPPSEHIRRVAEIRALMDADDLEQRFRARMLVKAAINDLVEHIVFAPDTRTVQVQLREGVRTLRIDYATGEVWDFNLVHPGRAWETDDPIVQSYLRRTGHRV